MKILFVCTGNTCRSPMAEGLFRKMAQENGRDDFICGSAGLSAIEGQPPSEHAIEACREVGVDISTHRAHRITAEDLLSWDLLAAVSRTHAYILEKAGAPANKIYVLGDLPDPFGCSIAEYRQSRDGIQKALDQMWTLLPARKA